MTTNDAHPDQHPHADVPAGDRVDVLAGLVLDARTALSALQVGFRDAQCPGCHSEDDVADLGAALADVHDLDLFDADMLLVHAAEAREAMGWVLLGPVCGGHDDGDGDSDEEGQS